MLAEHQAWAGALAAELKTWMKRNGYKQIKILAEELGIQRSSLERILKANVVSSLENYARIYRRTGIQTAYPVTIPKVKSNKDVWTNTRYTAWKFEYERQLKAKGIVSPATFAPPSEERVREALATGQADLKEAMHRLDWPPVPAPAVPEIGPLIEQIIAIATKQIADAVAERLQESGGSLKDPLSQLDLELDRVFNGSVLDRDAFMREHGKVLGRLFPILETLMAPKAEREQRLILMRR